MTQNQPSNEIAATTPQPHGIKQRALRWWKQFGRPFLVILVVLSAFRSAVADWNDVPSGSMKPSIIEGDRIFVNKLAYDLKVPFTTWHLAEWADPQRGDVVVLYSPADGTRLVKRVIGLPGDRIELSANRLIVNGTPCDYASLDADTVNQIDADLRGQHRFAAEDLGAKPHPVMSTPRVYFPLRTFGPFSVPAGQYFVMGDNRDESRDSRFFGCVPRSDIVGRSSRVVISLDPRNWYLPRWARFLRPLP